MEKQKAGIKSTKMVHDIVEECIKFRPTFSIDGKEYTFNDAFSGEINRIVSFVQLRTLQAL